MPVHGGWHRRISLIYNMLSIVRLIHIILRYFKPFKAFRKSQEIIGIPVKLVGLGEGAEDLVSFDAHEFVEALFA